MARYAAKSFVAGSPDAVVIGQAVQAFTSNLESSVIKPILPRHGFGNIDPEAWYPHQNWMNVLKEISDLPEGSSALVAFGRKVVETAVMPPEIDSVPKVLDALHAIHHLNLRNIPEEEGYFVEKLGERHYMVYQNTPNPDDAIYGFIWGLVSRYTPAGDQFVVRQVANTKPDQYPGTPFEIKWGGRNEKL